MRSSSNKAPTLPWDRTRQIGPAKYIVLSTFLSVDLDYCGYSVPFQSHDVRGDALRTYLRYVYCQDALYVCIAYDDLLCALQWSERWRRIALLEPNVSTRRMLVRPQVELGHARIGVAVSP